MRHYSVYNKITGITVICLFSIFSLLGGYAMAKDDVSPREQVFLLTVKKTYEYYCSLCHGFKGKGDGTFFTIDLKPKPRNFTDVKYMQKRTDDQLLKSITEGSKSVDKSNLCPPWGKTIPEKRIKAVVKEEKSGTFKTSMRWLFLIIITVALAYGAIGEWKKLKKEAS